MNTLVTRTNIRSNASTSTTRTNAAAAAAAAPPQRAQQPPEQQPQAPAQQPQAPAQQPPAQQPPLPVQQPPLPVQHPPAQIQPPAGSTAAVVGSRFLAHIDRGEMAEAIDMMEYLPAVIRYVGAAPVKYRGYTALHLVGQRGCTLEEARALCLVAAAQGVLDWPIQEHRQGQVRNTALHLAASTGHLPVARALVEARADVTAVAINARGEQVTPMDLAARGGGSHVLYFLRDTHSHCLTERPEEETLERRHLAAERSRVALGERREWWRVWHAWRGWQQWCGWQQGWQAWHRDWHWQGWQAWQGRYLESLD